MRRRASSNFHSLTAFLHVATCVISVAMLLSFPAASVHNFGTHFRAPEVRRAIERQTSVAQSDRTTQELVAQGDFLPMFLAPAATTAKILSRENFESPSNVPPSGLLKRRKLNPSGSGGEDPLLET
jgi:hypothetical protein